MFDTNKHIVATDQTDSKRTKNKSGYAIHVYEYLSFDNIDVQK